MPLFYVTGIAGSGKSEILKELKARGYEACGTDEDGFAGFYDNQTGERLDNSPKTAEERTNEWRKRYTWKVKREAVQSLRDRCGDRQVFLCGVAANEEEFLDLFDKLFALVIDKITLKQRILSRTNNNFGKVSHELKTIMEWQQMTKDYYGKYGFIKVDATKKIDRVADDILQEIRSG